jgi:hypothetical protein
MFASLPLDICKPQQLSLLRGLTSRVMRMELLRSTGAIHGLSQIGEDEYRWARDPKTIAAVR